MRAFPVDGAFVIRNATVLDGAGIEPVVADVVVRDGRIASVGPCHDRGITTIDGDGLLVAPGFIDCHCHDDLEMLRHPDRPEKVAQGITTVITGNCGFSLFPFTEASKPDLRRHAGSLLGAVAEGEVFTDFAAYSGALLERGLAINVAPLVGHGPLRLEALGFDSRPATSDEAQIAALRLESQLRQGATGLSLGLVYPPSAFAECDELLALCKVAARCAKPVAAHIRSYEAGLLDATHEFIYLLQASGARGVLSHLQAAGRSNWGLVIPALAALDDAVAVGVDVCFDMYPYLAGSSYALQLLPPSALAGGIEGLKAKFRSRESRGWLKSRLETRGRDEEGWESKVSLIGWEAVLVAGVATAGLKSLEGHSVSDAAKAANCEPFDILERLVLEDDGASALILFQLSDSDLRAAFTHPLHMVGSDGIPRCDGRPHPRAFGAFPRVLSKLVASDGWLSLPQAVRRMTSEPARRFALTDRGVIRAGAVADLVLFEPNFRDLATFEEPRRLAEGARYVWVGGQAILADGRPTGARPGRVLTRI